MRVKTATITKINKTKKNYQMMNLIQNKQWTVFTEYFVGNEWLNVKLIEYTYIFQ